MVLSKVDDHGASVFTVRMSLRIETMPEVWEPSIVLSSGVGGWRVHSASRANLKLMHEVTFMARKISEK